MILQGCYVAIVTPFGDNGLVDEAGLRSNITTGLAWEAEVTVAPEITKACGQTVFLDWGAFPGGYGWVFPKSNHLSLGVGGPASLSKGMMNYYREFLLSGISHTQVIISKSSMNLIVI